MGQIRNSTPRHGEESTAPEKQHTASELKFAIGCWYTSLLPVLTKQRRLMCLKSCHKARLGRAAPTTARRRWGWHENDGLPGRKQAHVAERQLEAVPKSSM